MGKPVRNDPKRSIRAPRGTELSCKSWLTEAPMRMLMNNLDPEVAERPEDLVVYGGIGRAARNWDCYDRIIETLKRLENHQSLLIQSGKPVGVFETHADAPRVLIANSNLVPHWATWEHFHELDRKGLFMFGQMTAGSWIYIASQGIIQGTYETFVELGRQHFSGDWSGKWILTAGLGGMGGAQPLAATMAGASMLAVECDPSRIRRRLETGYLDESAETLEEALKILESHHQQGKAVSVGLLGNAAEILPEMLKRGVRPDAVTVAEDVSGMPGLAAPVSGGGIGFDYRMAMGVTDFWFKLFDIRDEDWNMNGMWYELTNRRQDEKSVSYVECHDQALVGGKTAIFTLIDAAMYDSMHIGSNNLLVDRGIAIHKLSRLITLFTAGHGYLNFMGNEFGHPEWIDFPREGNNWSCKYARRQWSLADSGDLRFHQLLEFDHAMLELLHHNPEVFAYKPQVITINDRDQIIVFERGGLIFIFNFHHSDSYSDYSIEVPPGEYKLLLDSDESGFGGHSRVESGQVYHSHPCNSENGRRYQVKLYIPCRCALVIKK